MKVSQAMVLLKSVINQYGDLEVAGVDQVGGELHLHRDKTFKVLVVSDDEGKTEKQKICVFIDKTNNGFEGASAGPYGSN